MSNTNDVTKNPNENQAPGQPLDPDVIVPDEDAGFQDDEDGQEDIDPDSEDDIDETMAGGLTKIGGGDPDKRKII